MARTAKNPSSKTQTPKRLKRSRSNAERSPRPPISGRPGEPTRTCVGCRQPSGRSQLHRFVLEGADLVAGEDRPGRGAWICRASAGSCFDAATDSRNWARALRGRVDAASIDAARASLDPTN